MHSDQHVSGKYNILIYELARWCTGKVTCAPGVIQQEFYNRDTEYVAAELVNMLLVRRIGELFIIVRIVETECYKGMSDAASHAYSPPSARNEVMFGPVGHAYTYTSYGIHTCFNVVAHEAKEGAGGVLIRAVEPLVGIGHMQQFRPAVGYKLANGPGKLTQALQITKALYGHNIVQSTELMIIRDPFSFSHTIEASPRIGISKAREYQWRFFNPASQWVSR